MREETDLQHAAARARSTCGPRTFFSPGAGPPAGRKKKAPAEARAYRSHCLARRYWMRVRQYGQTFQSALSGRWQVGQTLRTWVLQIGQTTKSRSMGAPHLGQMP